MKKVCERDGHKRIAWALAGCLLLGASLAFGYLAVIDLSIGVGIFAAFCIGVYGGVIKLEAPKARKGNNQPKEAPNVTKPVNENGP